jgi:Bacteriophage minor capsid protein
VADLLAAVTSLMTSLGLSTTDVVRGPFTDQVNDQTALIDYAGTLPELGYCGPVTRLPRLAVQTRRFTAVAARSRIEEIYVAFAGVTEQTAGTIVFHEIIPQGEPFWLDEDQHGRTVYACNFELRRAA